MGNWFGTWTIKLYSDSPEANIWDITGLQCVQFPVGSNLNVHLTVCQMNENFNQTAGQVVHKSNPSCVVRARDSRLITTTINLTCPQDRLLKM